MTPTWAVSKRRRGNASDALAIAQSGMPQAQPAQFKLWSDILEARGLTSLPVDVDKLNIVSSALRAAGF